MISTSIQPRAIVLAHDADRRRWPRAPRERHDVLERDALQHLLLEREAGAALVRERRHGDLPAAVHRADDVRARHGDVVEEDLAELGRAGDLRAAGGW